MAKKNTTRLILALEMLMLGESERIKTAEIIEYFSVKYGIDINRRTIYKYMAVLGEFYDVNYRRNEGWLLK